MTKRTTTILTVLLAASVVLNGILLYRLQQPASDTETAGATPDAASQMLLRAAQAIVVDSNNGDEVSTAAVTRLKEAALSLPEAREQLAFVKSINNTNGETVIKLDMVEWFSGDEAKQAAQEDGLNGEDATPNGYYIRNADETPVTLTLAQDAQIYVLDDVKSKLADTQSFIAAADDAVDRLFHVWSLGEQVAAMNEQYRP